MSKPLPLDTLVGEFSEDYKAWVIQSKKTGQYLVIPDDRFPGRKPIRFFMSEADASRVIDVVVDARPALKQFGLQPVQVLFQESLRKIAADKRSDYADSFVVHSPNEVYEFVRELQPEKKDGQ